MKLGAQSSELYCLSTIIGVYFSWNLGLSPSMEFISPESLFHSSSIGVYFLLGVVLLPYLGFLSGFLIPNMVNRGNLFKLKILQAVAHGEKSEFFFSFLQVKES